MKQILKKAGIAFAPSLLLTFMIFLFGPSEIFFSNVSQFEFKFGEFAGWAVLLMIVAAVVLAAIATLLSRVSEKIYNIFPAVILAMGVLGYIQVMFLNKNLDLLGQNPDGYSADIGRGIFNLVIWIVGIGIFVFLAVKKSEISKKVCLYLASFLILIQAAGLISLIVQADETAYKRPADRWFLSGEDQLAVSPKNNVIVIVLDYFSNQYIEPTLAKYPDTLDCVHDFTYYDNDECVYFATFPSMLHMLTGAHVDNTVTINEWTRSVWEDPATINLFDTIHDLDYKLNIYTPGSDIYRGDNDVRILEGKIDNVTNDATAVIVDTKLLMTTVSKMSLYRMAPELFKNCFYTSFSEYTDIVSDANVEKAHNNYDFYARLKEEGVHLSDDDKNYYIIQHLEGDHERTTGADGWEAHDVTLEENSRGAFRVVEEYLDQLKAVGKYDDSTIIITADHGSPDEPQVIFFMKRPGESHDAVVYNHAPISHCDLLPTLINAMGGDGSIYGEDISDIPDVPRDRIYWICRFDDRYPYIPIYTGDKEGMANCLYGYFYTGDFDDLKKKLEGEPDAVLPLIDTFF